MERLTEKELNGDYVVLKNCSKSQCTQRCIECAPYCIDCEVEKEASKKLKAYEDAEEQGLLIRLPCEVGSTVYVVTTCKDFGKVLDGTLWGEDGGFGTATGYYCPYESNDSCPHEDGFEECEGGCECFENKFAVFEDCIECITVYEDNTVVFLINCGSVSFEDFGKTVFLTREEAEAAL